MARIPDETTLGTRPAPNPQGGTGDFMAPASGVVQGANMMQRVADRAGAGALSLAHGGDVLGTQIAEANERYQSGREAVARAKDLGAYSEAGLNEYLRLQTEGDLSDPKTIAGYQSFLNDKMQETIDGHQGSDLSKAALATRLQAQRFDLSDKATTYGHALGVKMIGDADQRDIASLSAAAATDPRSLPKQWAALEEVGADRAPARGPQGTNAFLEAGRSQIAKSAISTLIERQQYDEVDKILSGTPQIDKILSPEDRRQIDQRIIAGRIAKDKQENEILYKVQGIEKVLGRPLKADERLRVVGLGPTSTAQTLSSKIVETEKVLGRPLTPDETEKLAGISNADNAFGGGVTGAALSMFVKDTPAFEQGLLPPDKERAYVAAVTQYTQPQTFVDPLTQNVVTKRPELPPYVAEALSKRGYSLPTQSNTPVGAAQPAGGGGIPASASPATASGQPQVPQDKTLWSLSSMTTGAVPEVARAVGRTPFIGEILPAPQMTQAKTYTEILQRNLVSALQNNPKYAEGERRAIENEIDIGPRFNDTTTSYQNRLVGVDDALAIREQNAAKTGADQSLPLVERQHALAVRNAIEQFRQSLGVPPLLTPEQARKAPTGTIYRTTDGRILQR